MTEAQETGDSIPLPDPAPIPVSPDPPTFSVHEVEAMPATPLDRAAPAIEVSAAPAGPPLSPPREPPLPPLVPPVIEPRPRRKWREHVWSTLCHLMLFLAIPTVFLGGVITFFLWQFKGGKDPEVEDQGREALNFQINVAVLTALLSVTFFGVALVPIVWLVAAIFCVIAARKAAEGVRYRYPWILRVVTH